MAEDGYGSFSGGGSIHWEVKASDSGPLQISPDGKRSRTLTTTGVEGTGREDVGKFFTIAIQDAEQVRWSVDGNVLTLTVPIRPASKPPQPTGRVKQITKPTPQILVHWAIEKAKCPTGRPLVASTPTRKSRSQK